MAYALHCSQTNSRLFHLPFAPFLCEYKSASQLFSKLLSQVSTLSVSLNVPSNVRKQTAQDAVTISYVRPSTFPHNIALIISLPACVSV